MEIAAQLAYCDILFGASFSARLKELATAQMAIGEGVHVRVLVSTSRSLPLRSINFFLGETTTGEDLSAHVILTTFFEENIFAVIVKPVGADPTTAEVIEEPEKVDPLRSFVNAVLQQDSFGASTTLSWLQLEQLAKGERVCMGPLHPAQPSLPPSLLRQGVAASQAVFIPPLLDSDALSQEEIANSDGLRAIGPNTATSTDRYGLHELSLEDWKRKKEEDKKARRVKREYLTEEEITKDEEEEEKEKEVETEMPEELSLDVTPPSPPPSSPRTARQTESPLREDRTPPGSPPPPPPSAAAAAAPSAATPSAAPAAPAAPPAAAHAAPAPPPPAALAAAAVSPSPAASSSSSPPLRRSLRLGGTPPPASSPLPPPRSSTSGTGTRKRKATPPPADDVTDDDDAPAPSPRKAARMAQVQKRARQLMDVLRYYVDHPPRIDQIVKSVTPKVADHTICKQWRSVVATMRHRYKAFVATSQVAVRVFNETLLLNDIHYDEIEKFINKTREANAGLKVIHDLMINFSNEVYSEFEKLDDEEDLVCDDYDEFEDKHLYFKEKAAEHLIVIKEWHQEALNLHY